MMLPDAQPPAKIAHVDVSYVIQINNTAGTWICVYPALTGMHPWRVCQLQPTESELT